ncbi:hypothetical protein KC722_03220 [Candidatus Kaiserbacteria bacterium]|nr:hypothetical protein [Candidatus Kaiserbacteria bacterium]MCB9811433.1 hypothetical protein [Candidatus Nomurabacteria bacterium]
MDIISLSDWVVVFASFITPAIFLPQIIRIIKLKEANAVSLLMLWGSLFLQVNIFLNAYLHKQPQLLFTMALSIIPLSILIFLAHLYRRR